MSQYGKEFDSVWRRLRAAIPTRRPVRFRLVDGELLKRYHKTARTVFGDYDRDTGTICIALGQNIDIAIETLIHEYAHHVSRRHRHGKAWGEAYSRCYRAVYPSNQ